MGRNIPEREMKSLIAMSGGVCAFPRCEKRLVTSATDSDPGVFLGEMAHIVADSRQGPRGDSALSDEERDRHTNLLLLCGDHHKTIDPQPLTYSVSVLKAIQADHERRVRQATAPDDPAPSIELKQEVIHGSLLPLSHLPQAVFSAPCPFTDRQEDEVKRRIVYPADRTVLVRFLIREGRLYTFHDLRDPKGPFSEVIDWRDVRRRRSTEFWRDAEGRRRFVTLLNRAMYKYTATLGVRYDPSHRRFYFPAEGVGEERVVSYRPLNKSISERKVAWEPKWRSTGEGKGFWWHLAADLRFHRMADDQWSLSIRPERHLTSDGAIPLPPERVGKRVTRRGAGRRKGMRKKHLRTTTRGLGPGLVPKSSIHG